MTNNQAIEYIQSLINQYNEGILPFYKTKECINFILADSIGEEIIA